MMNPVGRYSFLFVYLIKSLFILDAAVGIGDVAADTAESVCLV